MTRTHEIKLDGYGAHTTLADDRPVMLLGTAESYGIEMLHIVHGKDWEGLTITATFNAADGTSTDVLMGTEGNIAVPTEATAKSGSGRIVFTGVSDGIQRISCDLDYFVESHSAINGTQSGGVAPSWFEQAATRFLPKGGTSGQVLTKKTGADFDAEWQDSKGGGGTTDHSKLINRDIADQHPISAITGLEEALTPLTGTTETLTPTQVYDAIKSGKSVLLQHTIPLFGLFIFASFDIFEETKTVVSTSIVKNEDVYLVGSLVGSAKIDNAWVFNIAAMAKADDIPVAVNEALAQAKASGEFDGADGQDGITPTIGNNGNWYLGETDTGKPSRGEKGDEGQPGKDGQDGSPGKDGNDGQPGKDGTSPVISVSAITGGHRITITDANGTKTVDVMDGSDGKNGADGQPGADGSPGQDGQPGADGVGIQSVVQTTTSTEDGGMNVVTVTKTDGTSSTFSVKNGSKGSKGAAGADGKSAYEYAVEGGYSGTEEEFASELGGLFGRSTVTVLSDNLFDKSIAITGKIFYHSSSGPSLVDSSNGFYAYVPLRGAGTYTAMLFWAYHGESYATRVPILKEDKTFLQNVTGTLTKIDSSFGYIEFTITETMIANGAALYAFDGSTDISPTLDEVMIVKDREYPSAYIPYGYIEVEVARAYSVNILSGKTAVFLGDSICAGTTTLESAAEYGYGWGGLIGEANRMRWKNFGRNGGTIAPISSVEEARWVPTQVDLALAQYPDADYVIFEGGCNDADTLGESNIGTFSASGYAPTDTSTFTGAFEVLVLKILNSFPNAKIGYIVAQKMGVSNDYGSANNRYRKFFDRAVEICQKWGIPVIDLWNETPLNPKLAIHYDSSLTADQANENGKCYTDGQHLTLTGYKKLQNPVEEFMRKL